MISHLPHITFYWSNLPENNAHNPFSIFFSIFFQKKKLNYPLYMCENTVKKLAKKKKQQYHPTSQINGWYPIKLGLHIPSNLATFYLYVLGPSVNVAGVSYHMI